MIFKDWTIKNTFSTLANRRKTVLQPIFFVNFYLRDGKFGTLSNNFGKRYKKLKAKTCNESNFVIPEHNIIRHNMEVVTNNENNFSRPLDTQIFFKQKKTKNKILINETLVRLLNYNLENIITGGKKESFMNSLIKNFFVIKRTYEKIRKKVNIKNFIKQAKIDTTKFHMKPNLKLNFTNKIHNIYSQIFKKSSKFFETSKKNEHFNFKTTENVSSIGLLNIPYS